ncbi:hypothetical protein PG993_008291 [Apiospora rasikravindrae]|uniref:Uncharacterized protein n=1 Tax=Apiospora rasikravindrae TaxID=990691 RepID=A0ABR1SZX9_9PEZI
MSSKSVKYSDGSRPGHKGRHDHDSGVGSLSSEQASTGGRPDRRFTAEDIERQRRSPRALQEALRAKDDEILSIKEKYNELLDANKQLHSDRRAYEKDYAKLCDDNSTLQARESQLQARVNALEVSNEQLSSEVEKLKTENYNLKRRLGTTSVTSDSDFTMTSGLGEGLPHRTRSRRDSKSQSSEMMDSMRDRIKPPKDEPKPSSKSSHGRRRSMSSTSKPPYIEPQPVDDVVSRSRPPMSYSGHYSSLPAHYDNYTASTMGPASYTQLQPARESNMPRTVPDSRSSTTSYQESTGNYVPHPLPQPPAPETRRHEHRRPKH